MKKKKLIVPFLFGIEKNPIHYSWIFYKYADFALENDFPIIAEEAYFVDPKVYEEQKEYSFLDIVNGYNVKHKFRKPTLEMINKLKKYIITSDEKASILHMNSKSDEQTIYQSIIRILKKRDSKFEKMIDEKFKKIEDECGDICAVLTWTWFPSLENICKAHNIKLIYLEQTTFRLGIYQHTLGYFWFEDKYETNEIIKRYREFKTNFKDNKHFFNRKELLSMFLSSKNLDYINRLKDQAIYEFGYSMKAAYDPITDARCDCDEEAALQKLDALCSKKQISIRMHPSNKNKNMSYYNIDDSKNSIEWILKNKRIISICSNVNFEAMLLGKTSYILSNNCPYIEESINGLDSIEDKVASLSYLNFIIFAYYTPYDLMFDRDYIYFRLSNPSIIEIYNYNLNYFLSNCVHISEKIFDLPPQKRLKEIIKCSHKELSDKEIMNLVEYDSVDYKKAYEDADYCLRKELEKNQNLKELYEEILSENKSIINSKSWKITAPLRWIISKIK